MELMDKGLFAGILGIMLALPSFAQEQTDVDQDLVKKPKFHKKLIASESYESVGVFDVNNDSLLDIVSGGYWYEGPHFENRHYLGSAGRFGEYYDDFSTIPLDVNGDGFTDFISGGWFGKQLVWRENPGNGSEWPQHIIAETGNIESTRAYDLDGDGIEEMIPNTPNDSLVVYRLALDQDRKGTGAFERYAIIGDHGHGLGFGDVNNDGNSDIVVHNGWVEAPKNPFGLGWVFHQEFQLGTASVPLIVTDVDNDGLTDLIVGQGHGYGLHWYRQSKDKNKKWTKFDIDPFNSQYHTMHWADIDGDGENDLVTGKRYRAHNGKDLGAGDPLGIYYFKWTGDHFSKEIIDYGAFGSGKGTGVYFSVIDIDVSGKKDVIVAGKDGLYVYFNL